jgi:asparagine synthase (glutamine-hydrolysing)
MNKILGWLNTGNNKLPISAETLIVMGKTARLPDTVAIINDQCALACDQSIAEAEDLCLALAGYPYLENAAISAQQLLGIWRQQGLDTLKKITGHFALAVIDRQANTVLLAIDRIGAHSIAFSVSEHGLVFATRADAVAAHPDVGAKLSMQSVYNYLYFFDIPAPGTIYQGVEKLLPGQYVWFENGKLVRDFYWHIKYRDEPRHDFDDMSKHFHTILRESVARSASNESTAAFLSGGTDSSTVAGILTELRGQPAHTYSIGFSAEGFDEMEYARIAGKHFGLDMHEYYLKPADILSAIPIIAAHYDEPFANESAVPTYFCAKLAKADGFQVMLGGDGGDEIFGGNSRYAKQKIFEAYHVIPAGLRTGLIEPLAYLPGLDLFPPAQKLQSYIRQANIPLPERMESYNYTYRQPLEQMFTTEFLASINPHQPVDWLKEAYERTDSDSYINKMLHMDLKFTLADNDLRKVNGMTEAAGIEVRYPLLDDAMLDLSAQVPPNWKVRGQYLRWFYKQALKGYLPDEIINKRKQGFGLPFGIWARDYSPLRERIEDRLASFKRRGWLQPAYIDHIRAEHMTGHATYFGKMLWVIVTLEEWLALRNL